MVNNESTTTSARADDSDADTGTRDDKPLSNAAASTAGVGAVLNADMADPGTGRSQVLDDDAQDKAA